MVKSDGNDVVSGPILREVGQLSRQVPNRTLIIGVTRSPLGRVNSEFQCAFEARADVLEYDDDKPTPDRRSY